MHMLRQTERFRLLIFLGTFLEFRNGRSCESSMVGAVDSATMKTLPMFLRNVRLAQTVISCSNF